MSRARTIRLSALALLAVLGGMLAILVIQRSTEQRIAARDRDGAQLLVAVLDLETGLRGYNIARQDTYLVPYRDGRTDYAATFASAERSMPDDRAVRRLLARQDEAIQTWIVAADERIAELQRGGPAGATRGTARRKGLIDRFRADNREMRERVDVLGARARAVAWTWSVAIVLLVLGGLAALAWRVLVRDLRLRERRSAVELAHRREQRELLDAVQVVADEPEAHLLVRRHLERVVPGAEVTVLQRNNSDDRLVATTPVEPGSPLAAGLDGAEPRSCLAIRQAREHVRDPDAEPLLVCPVCGEAPEASACEPFLVGGEVIGSVLVRRAEALDADEVSRVSDAVALSAPTLANLRSLAIAETRAATDALTGLSNRRSASAALSRHAAEAERGGRTLAAIALDLDHFKRINDGHGHDAGDAVLSAVGQTLRRHVRADDLVARMGGEEFLVLIPGIDVVRATDLAETLRREVADTHVPGLEVALSTSVGVAVLPDHAQTPETLVRQADRALYRAKELGRDRVEVALPPGHDEPLARAVLDEAAARLLAEDPTDRGTR